MNGRLGAHGQERGCGRLGRRPVRVGQVLKRLDPLFHREKRGRFMGPILLTVVVPPGDSDFVWDEAARLGDCTDIPPIHWWRVLRCFQQRLHTEYALSVSHAFGCLLRENATRHRDLGVLRRVTWAVWGRTFPFKVARELGWHGISPGGWPWCEVGVLFSGQARRYAILGHPDGGWHLA